MSTSLQSCSNSHFRGIFAITTSSVLSIKDQRLSNFKVATIAAITEMQTTHDSAVDGAEVAAPTKTARVEATSLTTFFDLPAEIQDEIYDLVTFSQSPATKHLICTWRPDGWKQPKPHALAGVSKQVRTQFLSRYHRIRGLVFAIRQDGTDDSETRLSRKWMDVFAKSRCPLTKQYRFWAGPAAIEIRLQGGVHKNKANLRIKVLHPKRATADWFALKGSKQELAGLVDSVLQEYHGSVYLTADGLYQIIEYLKGC